METEAERELDFVGLPVIATVEPLRRGIGHPDVARLQPPFRAGQPFGQELYGISEHDVVCQQLRGVTGSTRRPLQSQPPCSPCPAGTQQHSLHHQTNRGPRCLHMGSLSREWSAHDTAESPSEQGWAGIGAKNQCRREGRLGLC